MKLSTESRGFRITPEKAVKFIKVSVYLTCMWPPLEDESKISFRFRKYLSVFLSFGLFFPLLFSIVIYFDDMLIILKSAICMTALANYVAKVIIVTRYHREFEKFRSALNEFILKSSDSSKVVFQKYIDKCWKFQFFMVFCYYFGATGIILGPLVLPQKFPTDAVYPFSVNNPVVAGIIYAHQGFAAYLCAAGMVLDGQAALFLWYLNAKFDILVSEINRVAKREDLCWYVRQHQEILAFADELIPPIRALAFTTVSVTKILMISSGFFLISNESLLVKLQFVMVAISSTFNTFLYSWAADDLINISGAAMSSEFFNVFYHHSLKMEKMCLFIIHRAQKPIVINIPGLLATLSSEYYAYQILVGYQCSAGVAVDSQMAIYLWYLCVRFEGLILQMDYVENQHQLAQFIRNHQSLLLLTKKVIPPIRAVIFSSVAINKFIMICAGVVLLSNGTSFEKIQCTIMISFIALNIYTFIWPADCLIDVTSYGMSNKVLDMFRMWTLEMKKSCVLIMHRAQHPVVINIPGFLETLSNQYYSSFLSAAFSIFTALRAVLNS